jgi:hypothetical protein
MFSGCRTKRTVRQLRGHLVCREWSLVWLHRAIASDWHSWQLLGTWLACWSWRGRGEDLTWCDPLDWTKDNTRRCENGDKWLRWCCGSRCRRGTWWTLHWPTVEVKLDWRSLQRPKMLPLSWASRTFCRSQAMHQRQKIPRWHKIFFRIGSFSNSERGTRFWSGLSYHRGIGSSFKWVKFSETFQWLRSLTSWWYKFFPSAHNP